MTELGIRAYQQAMKAHREHVKRDEINLDCRLCQDRVRTMVTGQKPEAPAPAQDGQIQG